MSIFDLLTGILGAAARNTAERRSDFARRYERENPDMDARTREKLEAFNRQTNNLADYGGVAVNSGASTGKTPGYSGKTVEEWDCEWISIGYLKDADLSAYSRCVGLYRHVVRGKTKYVGRAIELHNGGFRKRLSDYRRESDSARKHASGRTIHEHLDEIETYILIVGDTQEAVETTRKLEGAFIRRYNPEWNRQINI